jgi:tetratricopeptide (TPR) repeat protein
MDFFILRPVARRIGHFDARAASGGTAEVAESIWVRPGFYEQIGFDSMKIASRRVAALNVRVLLILVVVAVVLGAGLFVAHRWRRTAMVATALRDGQAAFAAEKWDVARQLLGRYLARNPQDVEILRKYAQAQLRAEPVQTGNIQQAARAYREILRLLPADDAAFERLAWLYEQTGQFQEMDHIAGTRLQAVPGDIDARLAQARAAVYRQQWDAARSGLETLIEELKDVPDATPKLVEACVLRSELAFAEGTAEALWAASEWLKLAEARAPEDALPRVQRSAVLQALMSLVSSGEVAALRAESRSILESLAALKIDDPRLWLMLSEQWFLLRELDQAEAQLTAAQNAPAELIERRYLDPLDWQVALFNQEAKLALLRGDGAGGVALAEGTLESLGNSPQRVAALPMAIDLFIAGAAFERAQSCLDELADEQFAQERPIVSRGRLVALRARIAREQDEPYRVIELLEPLVQSGELTMAGQQLLTEAYLRTGQTGRLVARLASPTARPDTVTAHGLATSLLRRGAWEDAGALLDRVLATGQDNVELRVLRLQAELARVAAGESDDEDVEALRRELGALMESYPQRVDVRIADAVLLQTLGEHEAALAVLRDAAETCDDALRARLTLANFHERAGEDAEAEAVLEAACAAHPEEATAWIVRSGFLRRADRVDEAEEVLADGLAAVADADGQRLLKLEQADLRLTNDQRAEGLAILAGLADADTGDVEVRALLLEQPEVLRDTARAAALIEALRAAEGETGLRWRLHKARLLLSGADWRQHSEEIEELLDTCSEADPGWARPVLLLGQLLEQQGDLVAAEAVYSSGLERTGSIEVGDRLLALFQRQERFADARNLLRRIEDRLDESALRARRAVVAMGAGEWDMARRELESRLAEGERRPLDLIFLARVTYTDQQDAEKALGYIDEALERGADPVVAAGLRLAILRDEGRVEEAWDWINTFVAENDTPAAYLIRATYAEQIGRLVEAEADYERLAEQAPDEIGVALLGEFHAQNGALDEAIATWQAGLEKYPAADQLRRGLAKAYLTRQAEGDLAAAAALLDELESATPNDAELLWVRAVERMRRGGDGVAQDVRELLQQALSSPPATLDTYRGLARLALDVGAPEVARDLTVRADDLYPQQRDISLLRGWAGLRLGEFDVASGVAMTVLRANPTDMSALQLKLAVAQQQQDAAALEEGLGLLNAARAAGGDADAIESLEIDVLASLGRVDEARALLAARVGQSAEPAPNDLVRLAEMQLASGAHGAVAQTLDRAAAAGVGVGTLRGLRLRWLAAEGQFDKVVEQAARLDLHDPVQREAAALAAVLLREADRPADADVILAQAAAAAPDDTQILALQARAAFRRGDLDAAIAAHRRIVTVQPDNAGAWNNLAYLLAESGQGEAALEPARRAVTLRPTDANARDTLASILRHIPGRMADARREYERSVELAAPDTPARARGLVNLAQVCAQLGDEAAAVRYVQEALTLDDEARVLSPPERAALEELQRDLARDT